MKHCSRPYRLLLQCKIGAFAEESVLLLHSGRESYFYCSALTVETHFKWKETKSRKDASLHHLLDVTVSVFSANLLCPCFRHSGQFALLKSSEKPLCSCPLLILLLLDLMLVGFFFLLFPVYSIWNCNLVCIRNRAHVNKTLPRLHTHCCFELILLHNYKHDADFTRAVGAAGTL